VVTLRVMCLFAPARYGASLADSAYKHGLVVLWSLGLRKPVVARRRT
jgi:hypothetical protein